MRKKHPVCIGHFMLVVIRQQRQQRQIKNHRIEMMFWFSLYRTIAWRLWRHIMPFNYLSEGVKINENTVLCLSICFDRFTGWLVRKSSPQRSRDSFHVVLSWVQAAHLLSWVQAAQLSTGRSAKVLEYIYNTPQAFPTRPRRDISTGWPKKNVS